VALRSMELSFRMKRASHIVNKASKILMEHVADVE